MGIFLFFLLRSRKPGESPEKEEMGQQHPSFYSTPSSDKLTGIWAWLLTTDHKRISILYLVAVFSWFVIAVLLGLLIRTELMRAGVNLISAETYNAAFTLHGVIMIFLFIIPGMPAIFGNFLVPIQIGAHDVFFPKLNLLSWYLYMVGGLTAIAALFIGGPPDTGWTFYVPFSMASETGVSLTLFAVFILGFSSMLTAQTTRVSPISIKTEPSACFRYFRLILTFLNLSGGLPSDLIRWPTKVFPMEDIIQERRILSMEYTWSFGTFFKVTPLFLSVIF